MFQFPKQMKRVFKNENLQKEFEENGFVIVDFYTKEEINYLLNLYRKLHPVDETGFFPSTFSKDKNYRKTADEEIRKIGNRRILNHLQDFKVVCGSYIVKSPGAGLMDLHQDMTLVDESEYTGINIWCPLVDLSDENGQLMALKGSHRIFPTYRGASVPTIYANVYDEAMHYSIPIKLKAGEAIIFDQSILHWSKPNNTNETRPVTNIYFTHKDAPFRICYYNKDLHPDKIEVFEQDDCFMTDFEQFGENIYDRPKIGKSLGLFDYDFPVLSAAMLYEKYGGKTQNQQKTFLEKVKALFS